jgi:protein required for attachment to host cells
MNNNNPHIWVVVADRAQAKIFKVVKFPKLEEIHHMEHPESKLHNQDLISSKPGRAFQSGGVTRHAYQPETQPRQLEAMKFATDISKFLVEAHRKGDFNRLYVLAEPHFLGILRKHLNGEVRKTIVAEIPRELIPSHISDIEKHIENI